MRVASDLFLTLESPRSPAVPRNQPLETRETVLVVGGYRAVHADTFRFLEAKGMDDRGAGLGTGLVRRDESRCCSHFSAAYRSYHY